MLKHSGEQKKTVIAKSPPEHKSDVLRISVC